MLVSGDEFAVGAGADGAFLGRIGMACDLRYWIR
jgi:hypothetical protein